MAMTILKIVAIFCELAFLLLVLMAMGWIPGDWICKFLRDHPTVAKIYAAMVGIGLIASCIAYWSVPA